MIRNIGSVTLTVLLFCCGAYGQYAGRYTDGKEYAVYFEQTQYGLIIRPVMWTATQLLRPTSKDKFEVVDRRSRGADFRRDKGGRVNGVAIRGMDGEGLELRRAEGPLLPLELLLSGRTREAANDYVARHEFAKAIETARKVLERLPTRTNDVVSFLSYVAPHFQSDAKFHTLLGYALVQAGNRTAALTSFKRAYELDPHDKESISALARLNALPKLSDAGWSIPFPLSSVFAKPARAEIAAVEKDWATRDLKPSGIQEELRSTVSIADRTFNVRIVSHLVHGSRHYGAIIFPANAQPKSLPVIIETKGVSPSYFPLDLENLAAPRMMADDADRFVYVVPTFRGEVLNFNGKTFTSAGDRTDALDGATDDTIALLNVALETTPEADGSRICAFGHSRGGTVAMLTGIRDKRIDCVANWAGPTDWFYAMGTNGWTEQELWAEALRTRASVFEIGGQNVERFLKRAIDGKATLADVRLRMIASSPLYFAHRLPISQHHYGLEDPSVPVRNGRRLIDALRAHKIPPIRYQSFFYPDQGHDTDRILAPVITRAFLLKNLKVE
jgi:tetratricopeptide (TPR) repeat protein